MKVKEEIEDLEASTQAEGSEAKGGLQEEDGIRTGPENLSNFLKETESKTLRQVSTKRYQSRL